MLLSETSDDWLDYVTRSALGDKAVHGNLSAIFWRIVGKFVVSGNFIIYGI